MIDAEKILEGRRRGFPFAAIAGTLGVTEEEARAAFESALKAEAVEFDAETAKLLDLSRLERMTQGLWADAAAGSPQAVEKMLAVMNARHRLLAAPPTTVMVDAYNKTVDAIVTTRADEALISAGRRIAERIDAANGSLDPVAETKALYLVPHLMNVLRELGATPGARAAVKNAKGETGGKLIALRQRRSAGGAEVDAS